MGEEDQPEAEEEEAEESNDESTAESEPAPKENRMIKAAGLARERYPIFTRFLRTGIFEPNPDAEHQRCDRKIRERNRFLKANMPG